ncbi:hypothetical protein Cflav_PD0747 [Pedosphaera parvula Ellin514]|uniref:Uncharacterized protein n=1 Tax=Pedosphaera parvula (strain Ellin514) TaxID=320771 RepID=B9XR99_PEDPL|nr:hypothetical protein Cflav_PD0747 [Pedosphaera parvula Ellin514]
MVHRDRSNVCVPLAVRRLFSLNFEFIWAFLSIHAPCHGNSGSDLKGLMRHIQENNFNIKLFYLPNRRFQLWDGENEGLLA